MVVSTYQKRGLLRDALAQSVSAGISLQAWLLGALHSTSLTVTEGRIAVGISSGGHSASWALPSLGIRQDHVFEVFAELVDRYESAVDALATAGNSSPSDSAVLTQMLSAMRAVKGYTTNHMYLSK